ncbi:hypothetical protein DFJ43DRAFT_1044566 [Lentinula guzmanii]|uniref:Uncharacterized protein n=1 Tax=Lentinula guzmanii TaxID=2804957 RepID=A0AA38J235_9AGAR|nr:hypothetical protein DFJ43DRAFT_1044566 [Lentinula guzmanii]
MDYYHVNVESDLRRNTCHQSCTIYTSNPGWIFLEIEPHLRKLSSATLRLFMGSSSRTGNDLVPESEDSSQRSGSTTDMQSVTSGDPVSPPVSPSVSSPVSPPWESRTTTSENAARLSREMDTPISLVVLKPSMSDIDSRLLDQAMQNSDLVMETSFASPTMGTNFQQKDPLDGSHDTNGRSNDPGPRTWFVQRRHKFVDDVRPYIVLLHAISVSVPQLDSDGPENPELNNDRFATFWNDIANLS